MLQFPLLLIKLLTTSFFVSKNRTVNGVKKKKTYPESMLLRLTIIFDLRKRTRKAITRSGKYLDMDILSRA